MFVGVTPALLCPTTLVQTTFNPADASGSVLFSNGNRTATFSGAGRARVQSGHLYAEDTTIAIRIDAGSAMSVSLKLEGSALAATSGAGILTQRQGGQVFYEDGDSTTQPFSVGDVLWLRYRSTVGWSIYRNGASIFSFDPYPANKGRMFAQVTSEGGAGAATLLTTFIPPAGSRMWA